MNIWDEQKREANLAKHGVDFADLEGFDWSIASIVRDDRWDYCEDRYVATGPIGIRVHVIVFTLRAQWRRIISARKANDREVDRYESEIL